MQDRSGRPGQAAGPVRPLARTCAAAAVACLGLGAARPAPLLLGVALVLLLSIPWGLAVARGLAPIGDAPGTYVYDH